MREISLLHVRLVVITSCAAAGTPARIASARTALIRNTLFLLLLLRKQLLRVHIAGEGDLHEPDHHLLPALVSPFDLAAWVGIVRVIGRVVEVGGAHHLRPSRQG